MVFSYSFIAYVCENTHKRLKNHLGVKHENVELNQKGNNKWNRTNNRINEMLGH